jgi:hypothetical protein
MEQKKTRGARSPSLNTFGYAWRMKKRQNEQSAEYVSAPI